MSSAAVVIGALRVNCAGDRAVCVYLLLWPLHDMAEGHIEFTCPYVCVYYASVHLCAPKSCPAHNFVLKDGI